MATSQISDTGLHLRRLALRAHGAGLSDGQLLEHFIDRRDEAAFEALVRRHGPVVLGVCRRILGNVHDAEDAFQATFLVLARKAASLARWELVGNWLYGVAYRVAMKARVANARRCSRERQVQQMPQPATEPPDAWPELEPLLDRELHRLPEKYRTPVILCELEERPRKEVAHRLGIPEGTLSSRLATARKMLAKRLARHGLVVSAGTLAVLLSQNAASACPSVELVAATVESATMFGSGTAAAGLIPAGVAALAEGVIKTMLLNQLRTAAAVLLVIGFLGAGAGVLTHEALAQKPTSQLVKETGRKGQAEVRGTVKAVDAAQPSITLSTKESGARTFDLAKDAKVYMDDGTGDSSGLSEGKLADLTEGRAVTLHLSNEQKVTSIRVEGVTVQGILKAVNATPNTIQVFVQSKGHSEDKTFAVAANARVTIAGKSQDKSKPAAHTLADLPVGANVTLHLSADRTTVGSIFAEGPTVRGTVKAVDPATGSITLAVTETKQPVDKTFDAKNAVVTIADVTGQKEKSQAPQRTLADLPIGAVATIRLSPGQEVLSVSAEGPTVSGNIKRLDAAAKRITLALSKKGEAAQERDFDVVGDVGVTIDGSAGRTLGELPPGALVTLKLSPDQKTVVGVDAAGPTVQGTVTAVDPQRNSITIADKVNVNSYPVALDAQVTIDGKPSQLNFVPAQAQVRARLSADQLTVRSIQAEGSSVQGKLTAVNGTSTITVHVAKAGDKTYDLAGDVRVVTEIYGLALKLDDLRPEKEVRLLLTASQKSVMQVTVLGE